MQTSRLSSGKSFIAKRKKFIFNAFIDFEEHSFKRVLNYLETINLRFWKVVV